MSAGGSDAALAPAERSIVLAILGAHLRAGVRAYVFGSRATGRARPYSDLDLAVDAGQPLTLAERAALAEAFDESDLPWKVDLIDIQAISEDFRRAVERDRVALI